MRESILSEAKDTHVCFSRVSHGHVATGPHLFGNASASSVPFNQGERAFSCTNKRKQAPCWDNVFEVPCLWSDTCIESDKGQNRQTDGLITL